MVNTDALIARKESLCTNWNKRLQFGFSYSAISVIAELVGKVAFVMRSMLRGREGALGIAAGSFLFRPIL